MTDMPLWIQTLQALATPAIALGVGVVGFMQWRTAHQKVVMDLFERRLKIYDQVHDALDYYWSNEGNLNLVGFNARRRLASACAGARLLFGDDVTQAIEQLTLVLRELSGLKHKLAKLDRQGGNREPIVDQILEIESRIEKWPSTFSEACLPYLKMDQKRIRTPAEWLRDRNRLRLSYDDQRAK